MQKLPITISGLEDLKNQLVILKTKERPAVIQAIADARELGDLSENAEYHAAREKQSFIEGKILELDDKIVRAEVIDISKLSGDQVTFGATIDLLDDDTEQELTYQIVGETEADITKNKISYTSPIARSLIGKKIDDLVEINTPGGKKTYEILSVKFIC